jgi:ribosomal protein S18 acetylase RimI-like enzyme
VKTEFRQAIFPDETRSLIAFDRKVFPYDYFGRADWQHYEAWWMLVGARKVGCCAFEANVDFDGDLRERGAHPPLQGSLYIGTTGILPALQGQGLGQLLKAWQIAYARQHGFTRLITNTRQRNIRMIGLNRKFGFRIVRTTPQYYRNPVDATVVMELLLPAESALRRVRPKPVTSFASSRRAG